MVQVVDRTFDILEHIASADKDISISELHNIFGLPISTVHRLVGVLVKRGYVVQNPHNRHYGPGLKLWELGARATSGNRFELTRIVRPLLERLTRVTGETSNLVVVHDDEAVYLDQVASPHLVRMFTEVGQRVPLYCTGAGKAILTGYEDDQLNRYLERTKLKPWTERTITDASQLRKELDTSRECGFATDDEEREPGVRCAAAPVFNHAGNCTAALSISGPTTRVTPEIVVEMGERVRDVARECSRILGYRPDS